MNTEVRDKILGQIKFTASKEQLEIMEDGARWKLVAGGVRAGKSRLASVYLLVKLLESISDGTARDSDIYWLVAADYERTRAEFNYLATDLGSIGLLGYASKPVNPGEISLAVSVEGVEGLHDSIKIKTKSASDFKSLAMEAPAGIVCCEASQIDLESFWRLQERLVEKRGWLLLEGTFESSLGWYPERFSAWQAKAVQRRENAKSFSLPTWTNTFIFPGGREDPEIKRHIPRDGFLSGLRGYRALRGAVSTTCSGTRFTLRSVIILKASLFSYGWTLVIRVLLNQRMRWSSCR